MGDASASELHDALELRAAVRTLFTRAADQDPRAAAALATVNRAAAADPGAPQLRSGHPPAEVAWIGSGSNDASTALASVARDAIAVVAAATVLRECAAPDCSRVFIPDHGRRIWCSSTCGGRVRGLRHYALTRRSTPAPDSRTESKRTGVSGRRDMQQKDGTHENLGRI